MKSILIFLLLICSVICQAQFVEVPLARRVANSELIVEGEVIDQTASWDADRRHIYTVNKIAVYKVFKGQLSGSVIEVVTAGGTVGDVREDVSYGLKLKKGDVGVLTCNRSTTLPSAGSATRFKPYGEIQGFIGYDVSTGRAKDLFKTYDNISSQIYEPIKKLTQRNYMEIKKVNFSIK